MDLGLERKVEMPNLENINFKGKHMIRDMQNKLSDDLDDTISRTLDIWEEEIDYPILMAAINEVVKNTVLNLTIMNKAISKEQFLDHMSEGYDIIKEQADKFCKEKKNDSI